MLFLINRATDWQARGRVREGQGGEKGHQCSVGFREFSDYILFNYSNIFDTKMSTLEPKDEIVE